MNSTDLELHLLNIIPYCPLDVAATRFLVTIIMKPAFHSDFKKYWIFNFLVGFLFWLASLEMGE